ncbi:MAG TPA: long-chain fatty acid--CoA ligase [Sandaracinaceae bacterium LLY-WYZ-13_1]|nr:long-chain fatty acid--CoA ligase [Sandaracinaceae bacterium LLY-WYZ-13_1]
MASESTFEPKFETLVDIFENSVHKFADRPLFGTKEAGSWKWMTYRAFGEQTDELRGGLASLGVGKDDVVAIIANNRPEWAVCAYATYGLAARYVPMYESQLAKDWKYILNDSTAKVVFVPDDEVRRQIEAFQDEIDTLEHVVVLGDSKEAAHSYATLRKAGREAPSELANPGPDDIAGFIYTSGTTGNPKGVLLSHRNLASNVSAMHEVFPMDPEDRSLSFLPWAHSFGQTVELHGLFSMGASMGIAESVPKIVENLAEVRPTLLFSVPRIFNKIHDGVLKKVEEDGGLKKKLFYATLGTAMEKKRLAEQHRSSGFVDLKHKVLDRLVASKIRDRFGGRLKYAFSGGAAISKEVAEFIDALGITVYEGYGLTETSPIATANWPGARKIGTVGKPIPGVSVDIDREVTGDPKHGEIIVFGHNIMQGYHRLPEENDKVFVEGGGFRTGDMGFLDEDGFLTITGRIKEQYKLENGKYVVPAPLEELLQLSPYVNQAFVYGDNKPFNVALIVPDAEALTKWAKENGVSGDLDELAKNDRVQALMREQLDRYSGEFKQFEKIKRFSILTEEFTVENGLLTPKMSTKRRKVIERWGDELEALYR